MIHSLLLLTPAAITFRGIYREIAKIVLSFPLCSSWNTAKEGSFPTGHGRWQLRKMNFSCKSNCCTCVPCLYQEQQEPCCESSSNKTVKDSRTWTLHHVRFRGQVASSRGHTTLLTARFTSRRMGI